MEHISRRLQIYAEATDHVIHTVPSLLPSALRSEANKNTHFLLFLLYAIKQYFQAGNYPPAFFLEWKRKCFEMETDQKAAGVALNFSQERRYCNYKALQVSVLT